MTACLQQLGWLTEACDEECFQYLLCGLAGPGGGKWAILRVPDPWGRWIGGVPNHTHLQSSSDEEYLKSLKLNLIRLLYYPANTFLHKLHLRT